MLDMEGKENCTYSVIVDLSVYSQFLVQKNRSSYGNAGRNMRAQWLGQSH